MNRFDETVQKIAAAPVKVAIAQAMPLLFSKTGGPVEEAAHAARALEAIAAKKAAKDAAKAAAKAGAPAVEAAARPAAAAAVKPAVRKATGPMSYMFGSGESATGPQILARELAKGIGTAAGVGGGAYGVGKLLDHYDGSDERLTAQRTQVGKLHGEDAYRRETLKRLHPLHKGVFADVSQDEIISKADPTLIQSSYETMKRFAPHLAADPNAARSFLRENALYGTGPSYASLKNLADAEQSVGKASGGSGG